MSGLLETARSAVILEPSAPAVLVDDEETEAINAAVERLAAVGICQLALRGGDVLETGAIRL